MKTAQETNKSVGVSDQAAKMATARPAERSEGVANAVSIFPNRATEWNQWILDRRSRRNPVDPRKPHAFLVEEERSESGEVENVATIFLTNRECPWRCLMCDLWKNTLTKSVPVGAIPGQIDYALSRLREPDSTLALTSGPNQSFRDVAESSRLVRQIKLYNSGSFFDPRAIPVEDYPAIADRVRPFKRVIVECHPALVGDRCLRFQDFLDAGADQPRAGRTKLEVAMGLETAHPEVLRKLNKRMTLDDFARAADFLRDGEMGLRVFVLIKPPFLDEAAALHWARRSIDFAFDCGATVVSLIPTRGGNGALEALAERGEFNPPALSTLEAALEYGIRTNRGRVFADLWDLGKCSTCPDCFARRASRLREMNLHQRVLATSSCLCCQR